MEEEPMDIGEVTVAQPPLSPFEGIPEVAPTVSERGRWLSTVSQEADTYLTAKAEREAADAAAAAARAEGRNVVKSGYGYVDMDTGEPIHVNEQAENYGLIESGIFANWSYGKYAIDDLMEPNDPTFELTPDHLKLFMEGDKPGDPVLPENYRDFATGAQSMSHLRKMRERYVQQNDFRNHLNSEGVSGTAADVITSIIDPVMLGAVIATEIPMTAAVGALAVKYKWGVLATRLAEGTATGALTAGQTAMQAQYDPQVEAMDIAFAAALGLGFGFMLSPNAALAKERKALQDAAAADVAAITAGDALAGYRIPPQSASGGATVAEGRAQMDLVSDKNPALWTEEMVNTGPSGGILSPLRFDPSKTSRGSDNVTQDVVSDWAFGDTIGASKANPNPSLGIVHQHEVSLNSYMFQSNSNFEGNFEEWFKTNKGSYWNITRGSMNTQAARNEFDTMVGQAMTGRITSTDKHVLNVVQEQRRLYRKLLDEQKALGLIDPRVEYNDNFMPLYNSHEQFTKMRDTLGENWRREINKVVHDSLRGFDPEDIADAMVGMKPSKAARYPKRMAKLRKKMANLYIENLARGSYHADFSHVNNALHGGNEALLRGLMGELGADAELVDDLVEHLAALKKSDANAGPPNTRKRTDVDYNHQVIVPDKDGNMINMSVSDLFSMNSRAAFDNYVRGATGRITMAKNPIKFNGQEIATIRTESDWLKVRDWIKEEEATKGRAFRDSQVSNLDAIYRMLTGRPMLDGPNAIVGDGVMYHTLRLIGSSNFMRFMSNMGLNNLIESPNQLAIMGVKAAWQQGLPAVQLAVKKGAQGSKQYQAEMVQQMATLGAMNEHAKMYARYGLDRQLTDLEAGVGPSANKSAIQRKIEYAETVTDVGKDITNKISLNEFILTRQTAMSTSLIMQRLSNMAQKYKTSKAMPQDFRKVGAGNKVKSFFTGMDLKRLNSLGLTDDDVDAIFRELLDPSKTVLETGGKVSKLDFEKWDPDVRDKLLTAANKWSGLMIQRRDYAAAPIWMQDPIAKIVFQFQNFVIDAWHKQLLYGLNHFDVRTFASWTFQTAVGAATAAVPAYGIWWAMPEGKDKDDYFEENLSWKRLAAKGMARASFASFMPTLADAAAVTLTGEPILAARSSGLSQTGPNFSMATEPFGAVVKGLGAAGKGLFSDEQLSQNELKALKGWLPWQNWIPFQIMYQGYMGDAPRRSPPNKD